MQKRKQKEKDEEEVWEKSPESRTKKKDSYRRHDNKKLRFTFAEQKEFETIDEDIESLENRLQELEEEIARNATDFVKLNAFVQEKEETQSLLEEKTERWMYLNELKEKIDAQDT